MLRRAGVLRRVGAAAAAVSAAVAETGAAAAGAAGAAGASARAAAARGDAPRWRRAGTRASDFARAASASALAKGARADDDGDAPQAYPAGEALSSFEETARAAEFMRGMARRGDEFDRLWVRQIESELAVGFRADPAAKYRERLGEDGERQAVGRVLEGRNRPKGYDDLLRRWLPPLTESIREEQERCMRGEPGLDRRIYAPFLLLADPEVLAYIAVAEAMKLLFVPYKDDMLGEKKQSKKPAVAKSGAAGTGLGLVKVVRMATAIGRAVEDEVMLKRRWSRQRKGLQTPAEPQTERWTIDRVRDEVQRCLEDRVPDVRLLRDLEDATRGRHAAELAPAYAVDNIKNEIEGLRERHAAALEDDAARSDWRGVRRIDTGVHAGLWEAEWDVNGHRGRLGPFSRPQLAARLRDRCVIVACKGDMSAAAPYLDFGRGGWMDGLGDYQSELQFLGSVEDPHDFLEPLGLSRYYGVARVLGNARNSVGLSSQVRSNATYEWAAEVPVWEPSTDFEMQQGLPEFSFKTRRVTKLATPGLAARAHDRMVLALRRQAEQCVEHGDRARKNRYKPGARMDHFNDRKQLLALSELPLNYPKDEYSEELIAEDAELPLPKLVQRIRRDLMPENPLSEHELERFQALGTDGGTPLPDLGEQYRFKMVARHTDAQGNPLINPEASTEGSGGRLPPPGTFKREIIDKVTLGRDVGSTARDEAVRRLYLSSAARMGNASNAAGARRALSGQDWPMDVCAKIGSQLLYHLLVTCNIEVDDADSNHEIVGSGFNPVSEMDPHTKWTAVAKQFYGEPKAYAEFDETEKQTWAEKRVVPAFYHGYAYDSTKISRGKKMHTFGSVTAHPNVVELLAASFGSAREMMEPVFQPMVTPPAPWEEFRQGPHVVRYSPLMRTRNKVVSKEVSDASWSRLQQEEVISGDPLRNLDHPERKYAAVRELYEDDLEWAKRTHWTPQDVRVPKWRGLAAEGSCSMWRVYDAVNCIGSTRWRVQERVLRVVEELHANGGSDVLEKLGMPPRERNEISVLPPAGVPGTEGYREMQDERKRVMLERRRQRLGNVHLDAEAKMVEQALDVARKYATYDAIYYPHTLDFRGRVYPIHGIFNHMGADYMRGLLGFADGKRLGPGNKKWLGVHMANLCGHNKGTFEDRAAFADEMIEEILDSANNPIDGKRWWLEQEKPVQVLATCMELRDLHEWVRAGNSPDDFVSFLPVQMDGSCNGLQHYAALALDSDGAAAVNLIDSERPGDVYTNVASILADLVDEDIRKLKEALANGEPESPQRVQQLSFFEAIRKEIDRKLVKQTVMTSVYGVTAVGARQQVQSRLKERDWFVDDEDCENLQYNAAMYVSNRTMGAIKSLFTEAKEVMAWLSDCANVLAHENERVSWETPLGLPVVQPYRVHSQRQIKTRLQQLVLNGVEETNDVDKRAQRSAFPPNFVHSVDSSHMMMTASACYRNNVTFAAVHDSFWTHAGTTERMSQILREEFVRLYSHDLLADLKRELQQKHPLVKFPDVPRKGTLDINDVRKAKYFFS